MDNELRRLVDKALASPNKDLSMGYTGRDLLVDYYHDMDRQLAEQLAAEYGLEIISTDEFICGFKVIDPNNTCGCPYPCIHEGL